MYTKQKKKEHTTKEGGRVGMKGKKRKERNEREREEEEEEEEGRQGLQHACVLHHLLSLKAAPSGKLNVCLWFPRLMTFRTQKPFSVTVLRSSLASFK